MKRTVWFIACLLAFFGMSVVQAEPTHTVKRGETLSSIAGKNWKAVCALNKLVNCHQITVGRELKLIAAAPSQVSTKARAMATVGRPVVQQQSCITLGAAPWNAEHSPDRALEGINLLTTLTLEQKALAKQKMMQGDKVSGEELVGQQVFKEMLYQSKVTGKATHVYGKPICNPEQGGVPEIMDTYDLGSGVYLAIPRRCGNPAVFVKPVEPRVTPEAPLAEEPAASESEPEKVVEKGGCLIDPKLVVGQEHEPEHDGNDANSTYLAGAVYCTWRGETGTHGVGIGGQASMWDGHVNQGAGKFSGHLVSAGPAYEYISDNGWDMEAKLLFMKLDESFKQDAYKSERHFHLVGPSLSYNNYDRRQRGEKWFPEFQLNGVLGLPISKEVSHSWQGKPIADTAELSKFGAYFNAGARAWIYDGDVLQPYVQLGYFLESPSAESISFRIGVADSNRICGIGIGIDHDLKLGGNANAWGFWCDVVKGIKVVRADYRLGQVMKETGAEFDKNGMLMVKTSPEPKPD